MTSEDLTLSFDQNADDLILFDSEANDLEIQESNAAPRQINTVRDYEQLTNKPSVNFIELIGNKQSDELGLEPAQKVISMLDIMSIFRRTIGE